MMATGFRVHGNSEKRMKMDFVKKVFTGLTLRCLGAVVVGIFVVALSVSMLSDFSNMQDPVIKDARLQHLKFAENEKMLNDLSSKLASEAESLSNVEPAAGDPPVAHVLPGEPARNACETEKD